jgi:Arc/MetJ-type ribon-helix-helix transcriptional regulator
MTTLSIPINIEQEEFINSLIKNKRVANKADAVRKAINFLAEEEALSYVLKAEQEIVEGKILHGDLRNLIKKIK